jgi:hypothetical protein
MAAAPAAPGSPRNLQYRRIDTTSAGAIATLLAACSHSAIAGVSPPVPANQARYRIGAPMDWMLVSRAARVVRPSPRNTPRSTAVATVAANSVSAAGPTPGPVPGMSGSTAQTARLPAAARTSVPNTANLSAAMACDGFDRPTAPAISRSQSFATPSSTGTEASRIAAVATATMPSPSAPRSRASTTADARSATTCTARPTAFPVSAPRSPSNPSPACATAIV